MADPFLTLGAFSFHASELTIGAPPRNIQTVGNCLAPEPVQTVAFTSGYMTVTVTGQIQGAASIGETAVECLRRMRSNLETEVSKDANTLTIDWGDGSPETYSVLKNEGFDVPLAFHVLGSHLFEFTLSLNCLPT